MVAEKAKRRQRPPQHQDKQPGLESKMVPRAIFEDPDYKGSNKLKGKIALITGGDSGIGRAVAIAFAKEGADVAIIYYNEHPDARETQYLVQEKKRKCIIIPGDIGEKKFCNKAVKQTIKELGGLDILVNNAAVQFPQDDFSKISQEQLEKTFRTNIFSFFYMTQASLDHLKKGSTIINTSSVTAYRGSHHLIDYASTKGAIVAFTRSLAHSLVEKGIRVNGVAPGPVWTPLIPSSFKAGEVAKFGSDTPMKRAGQPYEIAPSYVFLASEDSSYFTGQVLHPNGGEIING